MTADRDDQEQGPLRVEPSVRRRRVTPTVERLDRPHRPAWADTGELRLDELTGEVSGIFELPAPSVAVDLTPQRRVRPRGPREQRLRLATAVGLLAVALVFFLESLFGALQRATTGDAADGWRAIPIAISSTPSGAKVAIDDRPSGVTPLAVTVRCRGLRTRMRVEQPGYAPWLWSGICPYKGELALRADLQPAP